MFVVNDATRVVMKGEMIDLNVRDGQRYGDDGDDAALYDGGGVVVAALVVLLLLLLLVLLLLLILLSKCHYSH